MQNETLDRVETKANIFERKTMTEIINVLMKDLIWIILFVVVADLIVYLLRRLKAKAKGIEGEALIDNINTEKHEQAD